MDTITDGREATRDAREQKGRAMPFTTYTNWSNPHVGIHRSWCGHLYKHGGVHQDASGEYHEYASYEAARTYAESTGLTMKNCVFCRPQQETKTKHTRRLRFIFGEFGEHENSTALDVLLSITLEGGTWHVQAEGIEATGEMLLATACAWLTKRCTADL